MKILVAEHSGFCFGVKRAVQILDKVLESKTNVLTYGPIIHNKQVTDQYAQKGVRIIDQLEEMVTQPHELIIRSHGVSKAVYDQATSKGYTIHDATCPYVKKIQNTVSTYAMKGYNIIIVGDRTHPEVVGINGWCDNRATIVEALADIDQLPILSEPICVVAQTTFKLKLWQAIVKRLEQDYNELLVFNTICLATEKRQEACVELAKKVDLMIVVGGKHSSNTLKLAQLCSEIVKTIHIETKDDLDNSEWNGNEIIGITAGASTPDWIIESVILKIEK